MGRMIGKLSEERTCYISIALLEIVSELTKCPPTIDEKGLLIKATYPLTGLEVYVRLPAYGLDAGSVSSLECTHDDILTSIEDKQAIEEPHIERKVERPAKESPIKRRPRDFSVWPRVLKKLRDMQPFSNTFIFDCEDMAATSVANAIHRAFHGASNILDPHLASPVFTGFQCKCMKQPDNTIRVFLLKTEVKND